jgi:hypothetical protein
VQNAKRFGTYEAGRAHDGRLMFGFRLDAVVTFVLAQIVAQVPRSQIGEFVVVLKGKDLKTSIF